MTGSLLGISLVACGVLVVVYCAIRNGDTTGHNRPTAFDKDAKTDPPKPFANRWQSRYPMGFLQSDIERSMGRND